MRTIAPQAHCGRSRPAPWLSRRSDLNAVLVEQLVIVQHHRPTSFPLFQVVGVSAGVDAGTPRWHPPVLDGRGPLAKRPERVWSQGSRPPFSFTPGACVPEARTARPTGDSSRARAVRRRAPDGGGAVVGGREAPGAVAVEPSVLHHTFGKQTVGAVARPPEHLVGRGHQAAQQALLVQYLVGRRIRHRVERVPYRLAWIFRQVGSNRRGLTCFPSAIDGPP